MSGSKSTKYLLIVLFRMSLKYEKKESLQAEAPSFLFTLRDAIFCPMPELILNVLQLWRSLVLRRYIVWPIHDGHFYASFRAIGSQEYAFQKHQLDDQWRSLHHSHSSSPYQVVTLEQLLK